MSKPPARRRVHNGSAAFDPTQSESSVLLKLPSKGDMAVGRRPGAVLHSIGGQFMEGQAFPAEYRIMRPDGSRLWVSGRGRVMARGPDGKAQRLASVVMDITDRKKAEEHIQLLMREISHRSKNLLDAESTVCDAMADNVPQFEGASLPVRCS
jgi:PAS domain-containing protein